MKTIKTVSIALMILVSVLHASDALATILRISQPRINLTLKKGESQSVEIQVTNPSEKMTGIRIYVEDWVYLPKGDGDKDFLPPGTMVNSASNWLTYNPSNFSVNPFGEETVFMTAKVPDDFAGEGTYTAVLFFETQLGDMQNKEGTMVKVAGRIGSLVYVHIDGTVRRTGQIEKIDVSPGKGAKPTEIDVLFSNTGNTPISLECEFMVFDQEGLIKGRGELAQIYTQDGMTAQSTTQWPTRLPKGTYDFVFTFDLGDETALVEEKQVVIS